MSTALPDPRPLVLVAHHPYSCGGVLPALLGPLGPVQLVHPRDGDALPLAEAVRGVVLLGSSHSVTALDPPLRREARWVESLLAHAVPVLGICFGGQLLAHLGGARIVRHARPECGAATLTPAVGQDWLAEPLEVMQWHQEGWTDPPAGAHPLAWGTEDYRQQGFIWGSAMAVQFHPEVHLAMAERWLQHPLAQAPIDPHAVRAGVARQRATHAWLEQTVQRLFGAASRA